MFISNHLFCAEFYVCLHSVVLSGDSSGLFWPVLYGRELVRGREILIFVNYWGVELMSDFLSQYDVVHSVSSL